MRIFCFGELLVRLTPQSQSHIADSGVFRSWVGGAEANVACALASLGHEVTMMSIVPDMPLADMAVSELQRHNVSTAGVVWGEGRFGLYFVEKGRGKLAQRVIYDRTGSAFACTIYPIESYCAEFAPGDLLHVSGISLALSETSEESTLAVMRAARLAGVTISVDCNYRSALWQSRSGDPRKIISKAISEADLLFANHRDIDLLLDQASQSEYASKERSAALAAFNAFPQLKLIACTSRNVVDARHHKITGRIDYPSCEIKSEEILIGEIIERIGTGDAFAAGILEGWISKYSPELIIRRAMAIMELKHGLPGDIMRVYEQDIQSILAGQQDIAR